MFRTRWDSRGYRTFVTPPRALRHYEDRRLLIPGRDTNGYRMYSSDDITRVEQIKVMVSAGLNTDTIRRYLDCARSGSHGVSLEMCPDLRADMDALAERLEAQRNEIRGKQERLESLASER